MRSPECCQDHTLVSPSQVGRSEEECDFIIRARTHLDALESEFVEGQYKILTFWPKHRSSYCKGCKRRTDVERALQGISSLPRYRSARTIVENSR